MGYNSRGGELPGNIIHKERRFVDPANETKLKIKDAKINLKDAPYEAFENQIKKYGFIGYVDEKQFKAAKLDKLLKSSDLKNP